MRRRTKASWVQRGKAEAELGWVDTMFDPDALTIGFARRVPSYKRLTLMLKDPARLKALLLDRERPLQLVIAGKSHPADVGAIPCDRIDDARADPPHVDDGQPGGLRQH